MSNLALILHVEEKGLVTRASQAGLASLLGAMSKMVCAVKVSHYRHDNIVEHPKHFRGPRPTKCYSISNILKIAFTDNAKSKFSI
jgi:hypothetical protein